MGSICFSSIGNYVGEWFSVCCVLVSSELCCWLFVSSVCVRFRVVRCW